MCYLQYEYQCLYSNSGDADSHGHSKEFVFGSGDNHISLTQHSEVILFIGLETPVQDVRVQQTSGLQEDFCRTKMERQTDVILYQEKHTH